MIPPQFHPSETEKQTLKKLTTVFWCIPYTSELNQENQDAGGGGGKRNHELSKLYTKMTHGTTTAEIQIEMNMGERRGRTRANSWADSY